eukprot:TRINITY_DN42430_c0_g3_i1.p1 TRINITY_DN42430_c0_g3~~TRINITY_DN42430_c0_g3_i1.p1  ORF type:complete len:324 (-),score=2.94 TRINITY_DN42430_c0_g3_i1:104-1075(-)
MSHLTGFVFGVRPIQVDRVAREHPLSTVVYYGPPFRCCYRNCNNQVDVGPPGTRLTHGDIKYCVGCGRKQKFCSYCTYLVDGLDGWFRGNFAKRNRVNTMPAGSVPPRFRRNGSHWREHPRRANLGGRMPRLVAPVAAPLPGSLDMASSASSAAPSTTASALPDGTCSQSDQPPKRRRRSSHSGPETGGLRDEAEDDGVGESQGTPFELDAVLAPHRDGVSGTSSPTGLTDPHAEVSRNAGSLAQVVHGTLRFGSAGQPMPAPSPTGLTGPDADFSRNVDYPAQIVDGVLVFGSAVGPMAASTTEDGRDSPEESSPRPPVGPA